MQIVDTASVLHNKQSTKRIDETKRQIGGVDVITDYIKNDHRNDLRTKV